MPSPVPPAANSQVELAFQQQIKDLIRELPERTIGRKTEEGAVACTRKGNTLLFKLYKTNDAKDGIKFEFEITSNLKIQPLSGSPDRASMINVVTVFYQKVSGGSKKAATTAEAPARTETPKAQVEPVKVDNDKPLACYDPDVDGLANLAVPKTEQTPTNYNTEEKLALWEPGEK